MQNVWKMGENVSHIVSECNKLAQNENKKLSMIKLQHRCTGSGTRLMDSRRMRNIMNISLKRKCEY